MDDSANTNIEVNQKAAPGSNATQIGQQINNYGMTPEQAFQIVMDLFNQNFPKLQALAKETAEKRANEFCQEVIQKIVNNGIQDFSSLADPDVQYILYEAQKNYARFGTSEMLSTLTELIAKRVVHDNEFILKVTIDKAVEIASLLSPEQLNYLSLLFMCTRTSTTSIKTLESLEKYLKGLVAIVGIVDFSYSDYLNMLGCLQIGIYDAVDRLASRYNFSKQEVEKICPQQIKKLSGSYITSHIGTILAITNLEAHHGPKLDPKMWIR